MNAGPPRSQLSALGSQEAQIKAGRDFGAPVSAIVAAAPNAIRRSRAEQGMGEKVTSFRPSPVVLAAAVASQGVLLRAWWARLAPGRRLSARAGNRPPEKIAVTSCPVPKSPVTQPRAHSLSLRNLQA